MAAEKSLRIILTFSNTHDAIRMEKLCREQGVPGRLIPVPRQISASCGLAWMAPAAERDAVEGFAASIGIKPEGSHEMVF